MERETTDMLSFGDLIKQYRKNNHLTQFEFSDFIEKSQSTVSAYENDRQFPETAEELKQFAAMLNISLAALVQAIEYGRHGIDLTEPYNEVLIDLEKMDNVNIRNKYKFVYQDREITDEEYKKILKLLEFERFMEDK